jgi:hypothetical protein
MLLNQIRVSLGQFPQCVDNKFFTVITQLLIGVKAGGVGLNVLLQRVEFLGAQVATIGSGDRAFEGLVQRVHKNFKFAKVARSFTGLTWLNFCGKEQICQSDRLNYKSE